jgi:hypothetical protein
MTQPSVNTPTKLNKLTKIIMLATCLPAMPSHAASFFDDKLNANILVAQGFQGINADDNAYAVENTDMSSGFQRIRVNIELSMQLHEAVSAFIDIGEEPNDFGSDDQFEISQDLAYIDIDLNTLFAYDPAFGQWTFRTGNIVSTVFDYRGYSDGAAVQTNPLIGNSPIDLVSAESGAQLLWQKAVSYGPIKSIKADIAMSVPTFFEDYGSDRGYNYYGHLGFSTNNDLDISLGWFISDLGDQVGQRDFSDIQTAGMIQGDGDNYNFAGSGSSSRDTHAGLLPGLDLTVLQLNAQYKMTDTTLIRAWAGTAKDDYRFIDDNNEQTVSSLAVGYEKNAAKMQFLALEASTGITENLYIAGRYSMVENTTAGVDDDNILTRAQLGLGWWLTNNTLVKAEYVKQTEESQSVGQIGDDWDGFSAEISVKF